MRRRSTALPSLVGLPESDPLARQARLELGWQAPAVEDHTRTALADGLVALARRANTRELVRAAGLRLEEWGGLEPPYEAVYAGEDGKILTLPRRCPRRFRCAVLHELAHCLLARARVPHTHADVWLLTFALIARVRRVRRVARVKTLTIGS